MTPQIIFIHIPKAAGSSLIESLIAPNVDDLRHVGNLRSYLKNRDADGVRGHNPYGFHYFTRRPVKYITVLRDPVERAVSWYYFIKGLVRTDLWKRHRLRDYADSVTLVEFYENPELSNLQTRQLAGLFYHKAYPVFHRSSLFRRRLMHAAKTHLDECAAFGLQSRFDESVRLFQHTFGWSHFNAASRHMNKTRKRPSLEEIDDLNPAVLPALHEACELDYELYRYASRRFDEQQVDESLEPIETEA